MFTITNFNYFSSVNTHAGKYLFSHNPSEDEAGKEDQDNTKDFVLSDVPALEPDVVGAV